MNVDVYTSAKKQNYSIVVPAGTSLDGYTGKVKVTIDKLQPWKSVKNNVDLCDVAVGDLFDHLEKQIADLGAGAIETNITFKEF